MSMTQAAGWLRLVALAVLATGTIAAAQTALTTDHVDLVEKVWLVVAGISTLLVGFAAGILRWVVKPEVAEAIAAHERIGHKPLEASVAALAVRIHDVEGSLERLANGVEKSLAIEEANGEKLERLLAEHRAVAGSSECAVVRRSNSGGFRRRATDRRDEE